MLITIFLLKQKHTHSFHTLQCCVASIAAISLLSSASSDIMKSRENHMRAFMDSSFNIHGTAQSVARAEQGGVHLSIKSRVGTKPKGAFKEGVHLLRVHLWMYLCNNASLACDVTDKHS